MISQATINELADKVVAGEEAAATEGGLIIMTEAYFQRVISYLPETHRQPLPKDKAENVRKVNELVNNIQRRFAPREDV